MKHQPFEVAQYYHVYNRGNNKENIFRTKDNYIYFLSLVKKYLVPICDIYSYCLLSNHFHFIIRIKYFDELPDNFKNGKTKLHQPFSNLFNAYTKAFNKKYQRTGSLFQEHLKRIQINNKEYLLNLIVYVNTNPTHHAISNFEDYKYSSYQSLISEKHTLLNRKETVGFFNDVENFKYVHKVKKLNIEALNEYILE